MTIGRFLTLNWRDTEARLQRLTTPDAPDPLEMWDELDHSLPGRTIGAVDRGLTRAWPESRGHAAWQSMTQPWAALDPIHRMRAIGGLVVTAAVTHIALAATTAPVGGWWLILPGIALTFGIAALGLSWLGPADKGRT